MLRATDRRSLHNVPVDTGGHGAIDGSAVSSSDVHAELVVLRQRDGMTMRRIQELCPQIMALRVTRAELQARGLHPSDSHVAAYRVLECGVSTLVLRTDHSRLLSTTLNLSGAASSLEDRRSRLMAELFITAKTYRNLEEAAYTQFAGSLVGATESPCHDKIGNVPELQFDIKIHANSSDIALLLSLMTLETREAVRRELARSLMSLLPRAQAVLDGSNRAGLGPLHYVEHIISVMLTYFGLRVSAGGVAEPIFTPGQVQLLLLEGSNDKFIAQGIARSGGRKFADVLTHAGEPSAVYFELKRRSLTTLADIILRNEERGLWPGLLPWPSN